MSEDLRRNGPDDDIPPYTFPAYVRDRWGSALVGALLIAGLCLMLPVLGIGFQACLLVIIFASSCIVASALLDYSRRASYYRDAAEYVRRLGAIRQYASLVEEPGFLEGRVMHRAIDRLAYVAEKDNAAEREQARAHREYIELWIHEVKTPIAAAKLMLTSMHGTQAAKLKGEMERIETQIDQALYAARSTALTNDYIIKSVPLANAARVACKKNMHALVDASVSLDISIDEDVTVLADEPWLVFMLSQVIGNAVKYGARSVKISSHEEEPETPRGRTVLEVKDDGCGIPSADVPRVFDRGFTGKTGRATGTATGMGLYLVATICERMGLGVGIASEEGVGTRVLFAFPHDRRRARSESPSQLLAADNADVADEAGSARKSRADRRS